MSRNSPRLSYGGLLVLRRRHGRVAWIRSAIPQIKPPTQSGNIGQGYRRHGGAKRWPREAACQDANKFSGNAQEN